MDYSLKSLRDAFEDAEYKRSRHGYELYALLLATSLDQEFVLEYLSLFHELDVLTGDRVLVIGPQLGPPSNNRDRDYTHLIRPSQLREVHKVIRHNSSEHSGTALKSTLAAEQFLAFMQEQTRESYAIGRYLGIPNNSMPALVFFDCLDAPHDRVEWPLEHRKGRDFVHELRELLTTVSDECGWDLHHRHGQLDDRAKAFRQDFFSPRVVPYELRAEWEASHNAKKELALASQLTAYYKTLAGLRLAYDRARADPELRIPLEIVGETIARLETGRVDGDSFSHLDKHRRRWKSRMPAEYKNALEPFSHPHLVSAYLLSAQLTLTPEEATREEYRLREQARQLEDVYEVKRRELSAEAEASLAKAKGDVARTKPPPLSVIKRVLGNAGTANSQPAPPMTLRAAIRKAPGRVPTVFVSYSHDSHQHAAMVLELAQRLRSNGVDCWIDQFERGPPQGFPRWMVQQIARADMVLLVCTDTYRRRFDGVEERGRGLGVNFEGYLVLQELYDAEMRHRKFIPILLPPSTREQIPTALRGAESFDIPASYGRLVDRIFDVGGVEPHPLGQPMEHRWGF